MSIEYKCNRCNRNMPFAMIKLEIDEIHPIGERIPHVTLHLCESCAAEYNKILEEFWEYKKK